MSDLRNVIGDYVEQIGKDIKSGDCSLDKDELLHMFSLIGHIKLNKADAAEELSISVRTFDRKIVSGKLPKGKKVPHHNNLVWYLDELKNPD